MFKNKEKTYSLSCFNIRVKENEIWILNYGRYEFVNTTKKLSCSENSCGFFDKKSYNTLKEIFNTIDNNIYIYQKDHMSVRPILVSKLLIESDKITIKKLLKKIK